MIRIGLRFWTRKFYVDQDKVWFKVKHVVDARQPRWPMTQETRLNMRPTKSDGSATHFDRDNSITSFVEKKKTPFPTQTFIILCATYRLHRLTMIASSSVQLFRCFPISCVNYSRNLFSLNDRVEGWSIRFHAWTTAPAAFKNPVDTIHDWKR